ncbi:DUF6255 family natural product biosynthesis protein [Streptomyces sp. AV19]|uniref:DUF6255 family natural product biosynthesis protein n=1 Tax=Streptomyces sp. AV19 TaxID=2793068 RepID=UPI0035ABF79A
MSRTPAANCRHPGPGWATDLHVITCSDCGVRRFPSYAALRWSGQEYRDAGPAFSGPPAAPAPSRTRRRPPASGPAGRA